jgi:hypothetical protein
MVKMLSGRIRIFDLRQGFHRRCHDRRLGYRHRRDEPVSLADNRLNIGGVLRCITQAHPDLANRRIDSLIDIEVDALPPKALDHLFPGYQFPLP